MKFYKATDLKKIKVLSFDLDNTIYDCQSVLTKAENYLTSFLCDKFSLGGECRNYSFWAKIKSEVLREKPYLEDDVTALRAVALVETFSRLKMPLKGGMDEAMEYVSDFILHRSSGVVADEVHSLLTDLSGRYQMAAVSNGNLDAVHLGVSRYFKYDIRPKVNTLHCKPSSDMFLECQRLYGVERDEILHIGDDPVTDVRGACFAGVKCAWVYKGYTGISPDERKINILPDVLLHNVLELRQLLL